MTACAVQSAVAVAGEHAESGRLVRELYPDIPSRTAAQAVPDRLLVVLCDGLAPERLEAVVRWADSNGDTYQEWIHIVLEHLFVHQIHHRGQVHNMRSGMQVSPSRLDEYFLTHDAPLREADLQELGIAQGS